MLNVRVVDLDFGQFEVNYASQATLVNKTLCLLNSRQCAVTKDFLKELRAMSNEKGNIDYGCDMPHVYRIRSRKINIFIGHDINAVAEYVVKNSVEDVLVTFEVTTSNDDGEHKTELTYNFKFPVSKDAEEIKELLFSNGYFTYQQDQWKDLIITLLVGEKEDRNVALEEQSEENRSLLCDLNLLRTYVKDLCKVLTPDVPTGIFDRLGYKDNGHKLVTGALKSISNKIAGLLPKDKKVVEERAPAIVTKPVIGLGNHDFDGDQLNAARMVSKMMLHGMCGAHGDTHIGIGVGDLVTQFRNNHPLVFSEMIYPTDMSELYIARVGDKHLLSRLIDTQK